MIDKSNELKFKLIKEGKSSLIVSENYDKNDLVSCYNTDQIFERDVTILIVNEILSDFKLSGSNQKDIRILDSSANSGIKTLRLLKELDQNNIQQIVSNQNSQYYDAHLRTMLGFTEYLQT